MMMGENETDASCPASQSPVIIFSAVWQQILQVLIFLQVRPLQSVTASLPVGLIFQGAAGGNVLSYGSFSGLGSTNLTCRSLHGSR